MGHSVHNLLTPSVHNLMTLTVHEVLTLYNRIRGTPVPTTRTRSTNYPKSTKAAMSIQPKDFAGLRYLQQVAGDSFSAGIVLYTGKDVLPMGENLWAMPISTLWHG